MTDDVVLTISIIYPGFEDLNTLACNLRPPESTNQFFALSAEHASADHFNPAQIAGLVP